MGVSKDGNHPFEELAMPPGTTIAECEEDHQVAADAMGDLVKFGYACVTVTLNPTSAA